MYKAYSVAGFRPHCDSMTMRDNTFGVGVLSLLPEILWKIKQIFMNIFEKVNN